MNFRWSIAPHDAQTSDRLAKDLGLHPLLARCILNRGFSDPSDVLNYLEPRLRNLSDPFLLPQMDIAVARLFRAREVSEPFVIFGDYDVDGVTSTALLHQSFKSLGWHSSYFLPSRFDEGYGLTKEGVENCLQQYPVKLILAVDCGSTSSEIINTLRERNVEVIVLDHHQVSDPLPAAVALVNPQLGQSFHELCSVGLAFKLLHALCKRGRELGLTAFQAVDLKDYLDLVALGTIADIVPLRGENRILTRIGLQNLALTKRPGLLALKKVAAVGARPTVHDVAFGLAPRLNAAGRLESALAALHLLLAPDISSAEPLAAELDKTNRARQALEKQIQEEVTVAVRATFNPSEDAVLVLGKPEWHVGVVGIVASRVLREFYRPTILLGSDGSEHWRGSGRSIEGVDLAGMLRECKDLLVRGGGHAMAAGVTILPAQLEAFRARLNGLVRARTRPEYFEPRLELDADVALQDLTPSFAMQIQRLEPFGCENHCIQLCARNLQLKSPPRHVGHDGKHQKAFVTDGRHSLEALWWNCPPDCPWPEKFDLAFEPQWAEFNGSFAIQLKVLDCRPVS
jgi:single-stranded-DNA-specific exonuclease